MKKTFALVLAIAMVMSLTAVSFAAVSTSKTTSDAKNNEDLSLVGPYKYDGDIDSGKGGVKDAIIEYGKAGYWQILYADKAVEDYAQVEKLKVKAKWEMGSDLVESISIVKKRVAGVTGNALTGDAVPANGYAYFVEVKVASKETTSDSDIIGTLTFNKKKSSDSSIEFDDADLDITLNAFYDKTWLNFTDAMIDGDAQLKWDTNYALKFDADDEVEISFGIDPNEGTFTVDVSGQGKIFFRYDTKANEAIASANPGATLKFINFNNAKFNRTGEFMYEMENGAYAYQIVDGKLTAIPGAEYDESDEAFYFNTRVLGSYVFSDVELIDAPAVTTPEVTAPVEPGNPPTGAAA